MREDTQKTVANEESKAVKTEKKPNVFVLEDGLRKDLKICGLR